MYYKTASIILNSDQKSNTVSDLFISQPDKNKEALAGKLFILVEIESQKTNAIKIINFLVNNLNFNYYQNDKIILKEKIESITVESIFETSLAKTNKDLIEFLEREKIKISPYAFNATVCVLYQNEIHFSTVGKNKNLLIYKEKKDVVKSKKGGVKQSDKKNETAETTKYKIADVGGGKIKGSETITMSKLFSDAINGKIPPGGSFLIINEALSEYISNKQLINIITTISPAGAAEQIKNTLAQVNAFVSFLGIIIKSTTTAFSTEELKKEMEDIEEENYKPRITDLEERTEDILKPAGIINFKRGLENIARKITQPKARGVLDISKKESGESLMFKERIFFKKRIPSLKKLFIFLLKALKLVGVLLLFVFKTITNRRELSELFNNIKSMVGIKKKGFMSANKRTKIVLIIAVILITIFFVNLVIINKKNEAEEIKREFNTLINTIEKNQNKVEANLLYNNENKAREIIEENKGLLTNIPEEDVTNREDIKNLFKKQEEQIDKIRHAIKVYDPEEIANFSNLNNQANAENIFLYNQKLYSADSKEGTIYKIDLIEDIVTALYEMGQEVEEIKFPTLSAEGGVYYLDKTNIVHLDTRENIGFLNIELPGSIADVTDIASYGTNLYLINNKEGQIYKYSKYGESFIYGEKWLNEKEDLSEAVDLFIDGNIYVFYKNGRIKKYLRGGEQEFTIEQTYTPITDATGFTIMGKYIYVLEPKQKRLIVFEKYGDFSKQYIFENMEDIKGFAIDNNEKSAYILNANSVYEIIINE